MELVHGGDVYSKENRGAVDFSANINPLGLPEGVKKALAAAVADCGRYPDPLCRELRSAVAGFEGVKPQNVFCSCGAAEIIYRAAFAFKPRRALVPAPTFSEYRAAVESAGGTVRPFLLREEDGFELKADFLECVGGADAVFLCNPNNPTGCVVGREFVRRAAERCRKADALLVVDECFMDFVEDGENLSAKPLLADCEKLLVLKAFTKIFAMPGVRLGYCLARQNVIEKLAGCGQPWSVSAFAAAAGIAAAKERPFVELSKAYVAAEREYLFSALSGLGLKVFPARANFLLFKAPVADLQEKLLSRGFLIRGCENFEGLGALFYRVAVKTKGENRALVSALEAVL